jgi:hypothetical protein
MTAPRTKKPVLSNLTHPCLQCQLKDMKCDRKEPSCSRCERRDEPCLFQSLFNGDERRVVLRRFSGETTPVFQEKVELQTRLLEKVMEDRERQNWILPVPKWEWKGEAPPGKKK